MLYQLDITLTEDDYLAFNYIHAFESAYGKKTIMRSRAFFIIAMLMLSAYVIIALGWRPFSVILVSSILLFTLLYMVFFKKVMIRSIKAQIKRLKNTGKLPFDPVSSFEFHEDKIVEITPSSRSEQSYSNFERVCVVKDRYIFLYTNTINAYMLPIAQINAQIDQAGLVGLLSQKCTNIEYV